MSEHANYLEAVSSAVTDPAAHPEAMLMAFTDVMESLVRENDENIRSVNMSTTPEADHIIMQHLAVRDALHLIDQDLNGLYETESGKVTITDLKGIIDTRRNFGEAFAAAAATSKKELRICDTFKEEMQNILEAIK